MKKGEYITCSCGKKRYCYPSEIKRGAKFCGSACSRIYVKGALLGQKRTEAQRLNISKSHHDVSGNNNPNYRGGITKDLMKWHNQNWKALKTWKDLVFSRDKNKCRICGGQNNLEAHHIIPKKKCLQTAFLRMNGVTLCHDCHKKTESFGSGGGRGERYESGTGLLNTIMIVIPHKFQEWEDIGNYGWTEDGTLVIFISDTGNERFNHLLFIHEFVEATLCKKNGISIDAIDKWDVENEARGDDPKAPYYREHRMASKIERFAAITLGINWSEYERALEPFGF